MLQKPLFIFGFFFLVLIAVLHVVAVDWYLYWTLPWFDILMHFLGGAWIGFVCIWLCFYSRYFSMPARTDIVYVVSVSVLGALVVGVLWEVFEYVTGITFLVSNYVPDTVLDLIMDVVGGVVVAVAVYRYKKPYHGNA